MLVPQTLEAVRALTAGTDPGFPLGEGYPHADTLDALRMSSTPGSDVVGWFIMLRDDSAENGRVIGDCGTKGWVDERGRVEIGYGLGAPWRGRGYGSEAVDALVRWLQLQPGVRGVVAEVEAGNRASRCLLERLGFVLVEVKRAACWFELVR